MNTEPVWLTLESERHLDKKRRYLE